MRQALDETALSVAEISRRMGLARQSVQRLADIKGDLDVDHLDVDSDGKQDLLVATGGKLRWLRGNGVGGLIGSGGDVPWGRKVAVWQRGCVL